jgi:heme/copper-type cytochrome/quinol oxidase subunit 2
MSTISEALNRDKIWNIIKIYMIIILIIFLGILILLVVILFFCIYISKNLSKNVLL